MTSHVKIPVTDITCIIQDHDKNEHKLKRKAPAMQDKFLDLVFLLLAIT